MENKKELIKKVTFDLLREGNIGCVHIEADCQEIEDLRDVLDFAKEASEIMPPIGKTLDQVFNYLE